MPSFVLENCGTTHTGLTQYYLGGGPHNPSTRGYVLKYLRKGEKGTQGSIYLHLLNACILAGQAAGK